MGPMIQVINTQCGHFYKTNANLSFSNYKDMDYHVSVCKQSVLRN